MLYTQRCFSNLNQQLLLMLSKLHYIKGGLLFIVLQFAFNGMAQNDTTYTTLENIPYDSITYFDNVESADAVTIQQRNIAETTLHQLSKDDAFWYANLAPERPKAAAKKPDWLLFLQQKWVKSLFWIFIIGGVAAVVIYFFVTGNINLFTKPSKKLNEETEADVAENIFTLNYAAEIEKAENKENFRLAVRLHYLEVLKLLAQQNIISYEADRTDSFYVMQLYNTAYYNSFSILTRQFEFVWYGKMEVRPTLYQHMKTSFDQFKQRLNS